MMAFLARRTLHLVTLVSATALLTFAAGTWAPGADDLPLRLEVGYSPAAAAAAKVRLGLERPGLERAASWLAAMGRGSLGISTQYETEVVPLVLARTGPTLILGAAATSLAWLVALPLGVWMAAREGAWPDRACRTVVAVAFALPEPVVALGLLTLAARTGLVPGGGMRSTHLDAGSALGGGLDLARHLLLPASMLALGLLPPLVRHVRSSVVNVLHAPFIVAARARGVPSVRLLFRSALRAAAAPLLSLLGLSAASLLSASLFVEVVTGWPGLGPLLVEATRARDLPVVAGVSACSIVLLTVGTTLADLAARLADPRTRAPEAAR